MMNKVHGGEALEQVCNGDGLHLTDPCTPSDHDAYNCKADECEACQQFWADELADRAISK